MGQSSSKRRTHSLGRGKNGNTNTLPRANGDDANGSIEVNQDHDVEHMTLTSPTSGSSVSPLNTTGKKEKRKRFRVGFSLKRTPFGRWSRKKKTPTQNGTRPVSSSDSLKEEQAENPGRPQSLFLEELDIHEDDHKIETVDLSDTEDGTKTSANEDKSTPKVPEKTKWKRGSHKKSSSKKKKKEKQIPKKEKKMKQKPGQDTPQTIVSTEGTNLVHVAEKVVGNTEETPHISETKPTTREGVQENETTINEHVKEVRTSGEQHEIDIKAVAVSLVAYTVKTAQERLRAESCHNNASTSSEHTNEPTRSEPGISGHEDIITQIVAISPDEVAIEVEDEVTSRRSETTKSAEKLARDIIAEIMDDKSNETIPKPTPDMNITAGSQISDWTEHITSENTPMNHTENHAIKSQIESSKSEQNRTHYSVHIKTENQIEHKFEDQGKTITSTNETDHEDLDYTGEVTESEAFAKKTVESVIAAAMEVVHGEKSYDNNTEKKTDDEFKDGFEKSNSNVHKEVMKFELEQETRKTSENEADSKKQEEGDKTKKTETGEKQEKVQEKFNEKHGKDKSKSEMKIKVPKMLSNWFHKKDKHPKTVGEIKRDIPGSREAAPVANAISPLHIPDSNQQQVVETIDCHDDLVLVGSQPSSPLTLDNNIIILDGSKVPLDMNSSRLTESSPDSDEECSPSDSVSPTSPTSDPYEKKGGSGFLKKIFLGPRLRTAILRQKSDGPSDEEENKHFPTTLKSDESTDLTPPPRKLRHRKPNKQSSPISPGIPITSSTDVSPQSPLETENSTLEFTGQSESPEANITVDDSGVADLTSPEGDKSDFSYFEECKIDNSGGKTKEAVAIISPTCATVVKVLNDDTKEKTGNDNVNEKPYDEEDDTRPIPQGSMEKTSLEESVVGYTSTDYFASLDSPTLISTAVITLRSTSTQAHMTEGDNTLTADINPDVTRQNYDSVIVCNNRVFESAGDNCSSSRSTLTSFAVSRKEYFNSSSIQRTSEISAFSENACSSEDPEKQAYNMYSYVDQNSLESDKAQANFENNSQRYFIDTAPSEYNERQFYENYSRARTVAEYQIGITDNLGDNIQTRTRKQWQNDLSDKPPLSNNVEGIEQLAEESHVCHSQAEESRLVCINNLKADQAFNLTLLEDSPEVEQKIVFQTVKNASQQIQRGGTKNQAEYPTAYHKIVSDGLHLSQNTCSTDDANDISSVKVNGHLEATFPVEPEIVKNSENSGIDGFIESSIQKDIGINDKGPNLDDSTTKSDADKTEPTVTSMAYIKLERWDIINGDVLNRSTSSATEESLEKDNSDCDE